MAAPPPASLLRQLHTRPGAAGGCRIILTRTDRHVERGSARDRIGTLLVVQRIAVTGQRAHDAARAAGGEPAADDLPAGATAVADTGSGLDGRQLEYVRTYARVAHTQLAAVLGALTDELDRLAELADGTAPSVADVLSEPPADARAPMPAAPPSVPHSWTEPHSAAQRRSAAAGPPPGRCRPDPRQLP